MDRPVFKRICAYIIDIAIVSFILFLFSKIEILNPNVDKINSIQNEYEKVTEFNEYGFAGIKKDGKWGSINENGEIVQEPVYSISWQNPSFIGKYYKSEEWYGELFYINKVNVEENN